jgi:hypothetical protein
LITGYDVMLDGVEFSEPSNSQINDWYARHVGNAHIARTPPGCIVLDVVRPWLRDPGQLRLFGFRTKCSVRFYRCDGGKSR